MTRLITHLAAATILVVALTLTLALGVGRALPRGEQILFSSVPRWQAGIWQIYVLDVHRTLAQRVLTSRTDTLPGLPVVWSPDGTRIAYMLTEPARTETFLVKADGGRGQRLGAEVADDVYNYAWSPDGRHMAFIASQDGQVDIYLADADGGSPRSLTRTGDGYKFLAWSPDSRYLAFESILLNEELFLVDVATGHMRQITHHPARDVRPAWSPDSRRIAFLSNRQSDRTVGARFDLYVMNADGSGLRRVTSDPFYDSGWQIDWSPTGQRILLASHGWSGGTDIWMVDTTDWSVRNLTHDEARDSAPAWSPDGSYFAFESRQTASGLWAIHVMDADGGARTQITVDSSDSRRPIWSPDGRSIAFIGNRGRSWDIYLVAFAPDGTPPPYRLTRSRAIDYSPTWRP